MAWLTAPSSAPAARNATAPILQVKGLNVYYGHSHALQGVDLTLDHGVLVGGRPQRHGQDHALQGDHGAGARLARIDPVPRRGTDPAAGPPRLRGSASATSRKGAGCGRP